MNNQVIALKRILLISLPKSGTYYASEILKNLGYNQSFIHLNIESYEDYSKANLDDALIDPLAYRINKKIMESIQLVQDNCFAVGHIPASNKLLAKGGINRSVLSSYFNLLLLVRDLRNCIVSHMNFDIHMRKQYAHLANLPDKEKLFRYIKDKEEYLYNTYKNIIPWFWIRDIPVLRYEELIKGYSPALTDHFNSDTVLNASLSAKTTKTLTKSDHDSRVEKYWSADTENIYRKRIQGLNILIGYDKSCTSPDRLNIPYLNIKHKMKFYIDDLTIKPSAHLFKSVY